MDLRRVEHGTSQVITAYGMFLAALSGRYLAIRAAGYALGAAAGLVHSDGYRFGRSFLETAKQSVASYPVGATAGLGSALAERTDALLSQVKSGIALNIKEAAAWLVHGQHPAEPFTRPAGSLGELWQRRLATPEFHLPDAAGRRWEAQALLRGYVRDTFYQAELAATIAELRDQGYALVQVTHPVAHDKNGLVLALAESEQYPAIDDPAVREKLFHPNALATIEGYDRVPA